ncbi:hypothetical protein ACFP3U_31260 [Kitasatospora misakiensis]|uniref:Zinc ribbon domain-containing protein n=1 Tax=Kitasatospora misakiensis TaxID=67330 RepID=A0ABW0XH46_9ACTN
MAICASCGAASAEGALACASCGRPSVPPPVLPPPPPTEPPAAPPSGVPSLAKPDLPPPVLPPPPPSAPPSGGTWGAGRPYDPAGERPAALAWLTGADWRPALRATVAPTAVLLLAALIAAVPEGRFLTGSFDTPSFGKRFGTALAMALGALGAPYRLDFEVGGPAVSSGDSATVFRALPMTVTVLWLLALWLGLRVGARRRQQRTGEQQTRRQAAGEAVRTAVAVAAATLLIGLVAGATWHPGGSSFGLNDAAAARLLGRATYSSSAGWPEAVGWTALLAGLLAFAVYGTDALRWAAWRNRTVRGWAVAGLAAGRALTVSVALAAVAGFAVVAVEVDGGQTGAALAFLPNLGLLLLGFGSGATFRTSTSVLSDDPDWLRDPRDVDEHSLFDLRDAGGDWRWAVLLALASAAVLGWTAYRRRLDAADRLRLAAVYAVGLSLLMLVAGVLLSTESVLGLGGRSRDTGFENSLSLVPWTLLVANAVWAAVGALAVPPLLAARDRRTAAGAVADPGPAAPGAEFADGTPMVVEVISSADGQRSTGHGPTGGARGGDAPDGDGPADPSVWSRRP